MKASGVEKEHSVMRQRQTYEIHCFFPSIMWVADSQPAELLTAGLLTNIWPWVWHSQVTDQV